MKLASILMRTKHLKWRSHLLLGIKTMALRHFCSFSPPQRAAGAKRRQSGSKLFKISLHLLNPENGKIE
jgi:hypothetical protein